MRSAPPTPAASACGRSQAGARAPMPRSPEALTRELPAEHGNRRRPGAPGGSSPRRSANIRAASPRSRVCASRSRSCCSPEPSARTRASSARRTPVKSAVMRDRYDSALGEGRHGGIVEFVTGNHFVGDIGECRHFRGNRRARLVETGEHVPDADDPPARRIVELDHSQSMISSRAWSRPVVSVSSRMPVLQSCPRAGCNAGRGTRRRSTGIRQTGSRPRQCLPDRSDPEASIPGDFVCSESVWHKTGPRGTGKTSDLRRFRPIPIRFSRTAGVASCSVASPNLRPGSRGRAAVLDPPWRFGATRRGDRRGVRAAPKRSPRPDPRR